MELEKQHFVDLNAATGSISPITAPLTAPLNIVSVSVDADDILIHEAGKESYAGLRVLLHFTGIVNLIAATAAVLTFQFVRSTRNTTTIIGPSFTFALSVTAATSLSFAFQYLDSDLPPGGYTYTVRLAAGSSVVTTDTTASVSIANGTLSAIAAI